MTTQQEQSQAEGSDGNQRKVKILSPKSDRALSSSSPSQNNNQEDPSSQTNNNNNDAKVDSLKQRQRLKSEHGRLSVRGEYNFGIPTQKGAQVHVEEHHGRDSWRMKVLEFIHQKRVQFTLMGLLCLDVVILFVELLLLTQFPICTVIERDCISCCPYIDDHNATGTDDGHNDVRFLSGGGDDDHGDDICEAGLEPDYGTGGCDPHKWHGVHTAELVLFSLTIVILSLFFIELNLEMAALRPSIFFRQFFYAMDYFIVGVSLVIELALYFMEEETLATFIGLLVFTRIWRFVRIGHGIVEVTSELTHQKYEKLLDYATELVAAAKEQDMELPKCPHSVQKALEEYANSSSHHSLEPSSETSSG